MGAVQESGSTGGGRGTWSNNRRGGYLRNGGKGGDRKWLGSLDCAASSSTTPCLTLGTCLPIPGPQFPLLSSQGGWFKIISKLCSRFDGPRSHFLQQNNLATFALGAFSFDKNLATHCPVFVSLESTILQNASPNPIFQTPT